MDNGRLPPQQETIALELNPDEARVLMALLDVAMKSQGILVGRQAVYFQNKVEDAQQNAQPAEVDTNEPAS